MATIGAREERDQLALGVRLGEGRPDAAHHQGQPDEQAGEQEDLPEAAQVDVLVALVTEPEAHVEAEVLVDR